LISTKVDYLLCDSNVADYEEAPTSSMLNLKVAQDLISMLVEQLVQMKSRANLYFEPLRQLKPSTPSQYAIKIINVQPCLVYSEEFYYYNICTTSCGHIYHPWCLVALTMSSRKCKGASCEEVF
jgi:hypothetical protein